MKIKGYLTYRDLIGEQILDLDEHGELTLRELLMDISRRSGSQEILEQDGRVIVLVNGRSLSQLPDELDTILHQDDQVDIFPPIAGG
ncbi:MoaD/ThiS family protein [Chloroflexota bacterium]